MDIKASIRLVNALRRERNLPRVSQPGRATKITAKVIREVAVAVWSKYPQALRDPAYTLGELTLALVEHEIKQRLSDLERGVKVHRGNIPDHHF